MGSGDRGTLNQGPENTGQGMEMGEKTQHSA